MITPGEVELICSSLTGIIGYVAGAAAGRRAGRIEGRKEGYESAWAWQAWAAGEEEPSRDSYDEDADDPDDPYDRGDPETDAELAATQAWLAEIGDDTRYEMERVAAIPDHYAADPGRAHVLQAAAMSDQNAQVMRPDWSVGCLKCQRLAAQALRCALEIKDRQGRPS